MQSTTWAVVTGASSGLGVHFAEHLANQRSHLILVARSLDKLTEHAERLRRRFGIRVEVRQVDLSDPAQRAALVNELAKLDVHTLVNNAGFGSIGNFDSLDRSRLLSEIELNATALTDLTHAVLGRMLAHGKGAVINVASTAAFQPIPTMAVYAATKAYVLRLGLALWEELHVTGVRVLTVCPGPTTTEFFAVAGNDQVMRRRRLPDQVIRTAFRGLRAHQPYVVDGWRNKALAFATRFAPTWLTVKLARRIAGG